MATPKPKKLTAPATKVGLSWPSISGTVSHIVDLLQNDGATALAVVVDLLKLVSMATARDLSGLIATAAGTNVDVQKLIADITAEFA
jgi:CBS domain-containing protein